MDLKNHSPRIRGFVLAAWTLLLGALYFVAIPVMLGFLNESLGWPTWHLPAGRMVGPCLALLGLGLLAYCNHLFSRIGRGSIVPIDPTRKLVMVGPYRYSRNPVFVGYLAMLTGIFLASGIAAHLAYVGAFFLYLEFFVRREEPDLLHRFGEEYRAYMEAVPRWLGVGRPPRSRPRSAARRGVAADRE